MYSENWHKFASLMVLLGMAFGCVVLFAFQTFDQLMQLKAQNQELLTENTALTAQKSELATQIQDLQKQIEEVTATLAASQGENQRLIDENLALKAENTSLNSTLDTHQTPSTQSAVFLPNFLFKLEQQPWFNEFMLTGITVEVIALCVGLFYLRKLPRHKQPPHQKVVSVSSNSVTQLNGHPTVSQLSLNGHLKSANKPPITTPLN